MSGGNTDYNMNNKNWEILYINVHKIVFTVITEKKGGDRNKWHVNNIGYATQNETEKRALKNLVW